MTRYIVSLIYFFLFYLSAVASTVNFMVVEPPIIQPTTTKQIVSQAQLMGISTVRIRADWARIQPKVGQWDFAWLDSIVDEYSKAGIKIVLSFGSPPAWAISYLDDPTPEEIARAHPELLPFQSYVTAVTKRYCNRVQTYQVWERPSIIQLLARQEVVFALFRCATKAVHTVDAKLRVIVPEPGDVDICWITNYLKTSQGISMPDILQLSPVKFTVRPEVLWWRVPALRSQITKQYPNLSLWAEVPLLKDNPESTLKLATACLLDDISMISFIPAIFSDMQEQRIIIGIKTLSSLQQFAYAGWALIGEDTPVGIFQRQQSNLILALPLFECRIEFSPSNLPLLTGIAVPDKQVMYTMLGEEQQQLPVNVKQELNVKSRPFLMTGALLKPITGTPDVKLPVENSKEVKLDISGENSAGIHLIPDLPGGRFELITIDEKQVIQTVRGKAPWIHVDIPDGFIFFNQKNIPVEVTIYVMGSSEAETNGFNLYYDAQTEMQYSKWQWIDVGPGKVFSYTFLLKDALFANRDGYDFFINMGGSRDALRVVGIAVTKVN